MKKICLLLFVCLIGCDTSNQTTSTSDPDIQTKTNDQTVIRPEFTVTPAAATVLKNAAESENAKYVRASVQGGGCSGFVYALNVTHDYNAAEDKLFEFEGVNLIIDNTSFLYMMGTTLDYINTDVEAGFKFDNPNTLTAPETE